MKSIRFTFDKITDHAAMHDASQQNVRAPDASSC
jgi:hypothetical protein